ncbi:MAG: hypothetical protein DCC68_02705 [Planctomycetota bacterium]|nr:MAG: hypothetical protein DCC68_02705 [Planctomycetota bacterium]
MNRKAAKTQRRSVSDIHKCRLCSFAPLRLISTRSGAILAVLVLAASGCGRPVSREAAYEPLALSLKHADMLGDPPAPPKLDFVDVDRAVVAAIQRAEEGVRKNPDSADAWGKLGMVLLAHEFDEAAAACLAQTEILQPDEPRWPFLQGMAVLRWRPGDAVPLLERAVKRLPPLGTSAATESASLSEAQKAAGASAIRLRLFELYVELDRPKDAEAPLRQFLKTDPENGRAHLIAARIALRGGRLEECLREVELAGYARPAQKPVHELRAEAFSRQGRKTDAEAERRMAAGVAQVAWPGPYDDDLDSLRTGLKVALSRADRYYVNGKPQASIDVLNDVVKEYPESEWAWILLGRAQIKLRRLDEAQASLEKALAISPKSADALFRMGVVHFVRGEYAEAAEWYRKVIEQKADHPVALYNLGQCARHLKQPDVAADYFRQAIACAPDNFELLFALGALLADEGKTEEGRRYLEQAKKLSPRDPRVLERLYELDRRGAKGEEGESRPTDGTHEPRPAGTSTPQARPAD